MSATGIVYVKGSVLLYREKDMDGVPYGGWHLFHSPRKSFASLNRFVEQNFKSRLTLVHNEGVFPLKKGETTVYLVKEKSALLFPKTYEVGFFSEQGLTNIYVEKEDRQILTRFFALGFYYLGHLGQDYSLEDAKAANALLSSLEFFAQKEHFPREEIAIFKTMIERHAPLASLQKAHRYLLAFYDCDMQRFLDRLKTLKKMKEKRPA